MEEGRNHDRPTVSFGIGGGGGRRKLIEIHVHNEITGGEIQKIIK
jgi:hypothetical protein